MTMHLAHPALNSSGKFKSKRRKFMSAAAAAKERELTIEWERKQKEWAKLTPKFSTKPTVQQSQKKSLVPSPMYPPGREPKQSIQSRDTGVTGAVTIKQTQHYTGDSVLGVTILHKSCLQPVFSKQEAIDAAKMRR